MKSLSRLNQIGNILLAGVGIVAIYYVNFQIIGSWFSKNGPANLGSIEVSYISMARFILDFHFSSWAPFWYFGFPFHLFYTPLLPFFEAFLHAVFNMPLWESYRFITGIAYVLGPISVFFLAWQLSKKVISGIIAGIFYSVGPTIFYFFVPGVLGDKFSLDFYDPRRFTVLVRWGEGPHLFSLIFLPLVGVFYSKLLEKPKFSYLILTSLFLGLAALSNAIGLFSSILLLVCMTFVRFSQNIYMQNKIITLFFISGFIALGFISFWYNISFISNFFGEGEGASKVYLSLFPWGWIGATFIIIILHFLFSRIIKDFGIAFSLLWFGILFTVVAIYYTTKTLELLPQALRYNIEVDLSLSILIGVVFGKLFKLGSSRFKMIETVGVGVGLLVSFMLIVYIQPFIPTASKAGSFSLDLSKTAEYEITTFLKTHVDESKGERVFVPGNYGFYLNYFTNVWQHRGGLFQAAINKWPDHMHYQIATGKNAELTRAWLVIGNIKYAVVTTPGSRELYKEIKYPDKFSSYKVLYDQGGDFIYEIPLKRPSLAKPVDIFSMQQLKEPEKGDDKKNIFAYSNWVENSSNNTTELIKINNDKYMIKGNVKKNEGILVQMSYHEGFRAVDSVSGRKLRIGRDPMGFLMLYPDLDGNVDISLVHGAVWKQYLGYFISIATIFLVIYIGLSKKSAEFEKYFIAQTGRKTSSPATEIEE